MRRSKSISVLKKELDKVFSLYIRHVFPKVCYTCGKIDVKLQCGHFVARNYLATRFDEDNCRPQCVGCNIWGNGKPLDFEEHLVREIGKKRVDLLKKKRHEITILTPEWYEDRIAHYKAVLQ